MARVLLAWIGNTDLRAAQGEEQAGIGPIAQALKSGTYDEAFLLSNYPNRDVEPFIKWLGQQSKSKLSVRPVSLASAQLASVVSSGQLQLAWPADHTGWRLQMQTNSLASGLGTNWITVAGSTNSNQSTIPLNTTDASAFFRLIYP